MRNRLRILIGLVAVGTWIGCLVATASAQVVVYDNLSTPVTQGFVSSDSTNPVYGHGLNLAQGGTLSNFGLTLYNTSAFGGGPILTGTTTVNFYDNTNPYTSGSLSAHDPLLGTANINWDFTGTGGLAPDFFSTKTVDLSALNITLPSHILVTQSFNETSGTGNGNGVVLFSDPTVASSPDNLYFMDTSFEGLESVGNNQVGYHVEVVPEPGSVALLGLGTLAGLSRRRRVPCTVRSRGK